MLLSFFIPHFYAIVPVYETRQCQHFYDTFQTLSPDEATMDVIFQVNVWFYLCCNWLELCLAVMFSYRIRNVRDDLNISIELFAITFCWITFSMVYLGTAFSHITIDNGNVVSSMP